MYMYANVVGINQEDVETKYHKKKEGRSRRSICRRKIEKKKCFFLSYLHY